MENLNEIFHTYTVDLFTMPPLRIQYASNLFVDLHKQSFSKLVKPAAPTLALLGNIGRPESAKTYHFLNYCAKNWDTVLWIPGPHELTNTNQARATYKEKLNNAQALATQIKIRLMDSKEHVFHNHGIVLLGTPLWTHLTLPPKGQPEFERIYSSVDEAGPIPLTYTTRNKWHKEDMLFLKERSLFWTIVKPGVRFVYLTHTLPSSLLLRSPVGEQQWSRLRMDMMAPSIGPPLAAWLGGATGSTHAVKIGSDPEDQVHCAVNSLYEYPSISAALKEDYNPQAVLEIASPKRGGVSPLYLPHLVLPPLLSSLIKPNVSLAYA